MAPEQWFQLRYLLRDNAVEPEPYAWTMSRAFTEPQVKRAVAADAPECVRMRGLTRENAVSEERLRALGTTDLHGDEVLELHFANARASESAA
jgi:hypothetical protein